MTNLRELDLSENNLVVLPATFSVGLKRLRRLLLRGNRLGRLPRLLARLPALEHLDLSHNDPLQARLPAPPLFLHVFYANSKLSDLSLNLNF